MMTEVPQGPFTNMSVNDNTYNFEGLNPNDNLRSSKRLSDPSLDSDLEEESKGLQT
jgi:hypothetical protein